MGDADDPNSSKSLKELDEQLSRARQRSKVAEAPSRAQPNALGFAFRIISELVAAVAVGIAIGWLLDHWLETRPVFVLIFFMLGSAAGVLNVYRAATRLDQRTKQAENDRKTSQQRGLDDKRD